ncbi:MAG TPA: ATP-binding protein [Syntrophobacteraceae bacterium]|nr:ATP-binding protein [Syntrophobacteraceae bacterium]
METIESRLIVPSRMSYLSPVLEYVRELARTVGFAEQEVRFIQLAVEEAVTNVILHGYQGKPDAVFEVVCEQTAAGLTFSIREKGIPFDWTKLPEYSPDLARADQPVGGLGAHLMKSAMDEVAFLNHGRGGKEIRLTKYLGEKHIQTYPGGDVSRAQEIPADRSGPLRRPAWTVRELDPDEAVEVSRCAYRTYGYTYDDYIYYPERIRDLVHRGLLYSVVAVTDSGQIIGHAALKKTHAEDPIAELGAFFIVPEFRGSTVFLRLCGFIKQIAPGLGLRGFFARSVSAHTITQRGTAHFGLRDCGLLMGVPPEKIEFTNFSATPRRMGTRVLSFISVEEPRERVIYPPSELRDLVEKLYGNLNIPVVVGSTGEGASLALEGETELTSTRTMATNVADIEVFRVGEHARDVVRRRCHLYRLEGAAVLFLYLDLEDPRTAALASDLLQDGFLLAGILPLRMRGRDALILQYLNNLKVSYDLIHLHSSLAKDLLAHVRDHDPAPA